MGDVPPGDCDRRRGISRTGIGWVRVMSKTHSRYIGLLGMGLLAGIVANLVMVLLMVAGRYWLGISPPPEALPDRFAPTISIKQFFDLFDRFGGYNGLKKFGIKSGLTGLGVAGAVVGVV